MDDNQGRNDGSLSARAALAAERLSLAFTVAWAAVLPTRLVLLSLPDPPRIALAVKAWMPLAAAILMEALADALAELSEANRKTYGNKNKGNENDKDNDKHKRQARQGI